MIRFIGLLILLWLCVSFPLIASLLLTTALIAIVCLIVASWMADGAQS